jgi:hypothetical protein
MRREYACVIRSKYRFWVTQEMFTEAGELTADRQNRDRDGRDPRNKYESVVGKGIVWANWLAFPHGNAVVEGQ